MEKASSCSAIKGLLLSLAIMMAAALGVTDVPWAKERKVVVPMPHPSFAYVTNENSNTVAVIDTATNAVVDLIKPAKTQFNSSLISSWRSNPQQTWAQSGSEPN